MGTVWMTATLYGVPDGSFFTRSILYLSESKFLDPPHETQISSCVLPSLAGLAPILPVYATCRTGIDSICL
ncbi:hypothetical protein N7468_008358 [Penicillium chermesinum]|uniref:Uncharacterized protein n=1 Tax=Penicillium chermesinum TaxID=63820 RepID=A0A9W9NPL2_9EURO|nr:uncharacterized protein N7468_008358 [Penicillium chermesinum]KAJ5223816.1 hypothetical protein N7468_008358 [Penicillium chermesinum]